MKRTNTDSDADSGLLERWAVAACGAIANKKTWMMMMMMTRTLLDEGANTMESQEGQSGHQLL